MNKRNRRKGNHIILQLGLLMTLLAFCKPEVAAQEKYAAYEGMYGGYGAKVVLMLQDEIRFYMIVTEGKQSVENLKFEYKSIMSSRGPVEIKDHQYAYGRGRYEGTFIMEAGKAIAVNHAGDEKKKLASMAQLLKFMEVDARALLQYMTANHDMSADRVKELVLAPKLTEYLAGVDLAKFGLVDILLAADKL